MRVGIDGSRAFLGQRTGIEEYSYQLIKHLAYRQAGLTDKLNGHQVVLYLRKNQKIDFDLPKDWKKKIIKWPRFWTQIGLSREMFFSPVDILLVPAHTVPIIHPKNTVVVIHGLEYEVMPEGYSFWARLYMRYSIKKSCQWAEKIVAVSKNTKKDLIAFYKVPEDKIEVIYEGINRMARNVDRVTQDPDRSTLHAPRSTKYLLFIGRLEKRKNIEGMISAFEILKDKYDIPHKLILVGKPGYGYKNIRYQISNSKFKEDMILPGFVSDREKWELLKNADVFLFPTFYEGFGLPVLEAQSVGTPVVLSNTSSLPEVGGDSVAYCDPNEPVTIADAAYKLISDKDFWDGIIEKGYENVKRFSWDKCAEEIADLMIKNYK